MRKIALAILIAIGVCTQAIGQAPSPVPALPDTERRTTYTLSSQTGPLDVGFAVFGDGTDYGAWIEVWLNGVRLIPVTDWTLGLASGSLTTSARPLTNARITLTAARTGTLQIVGAQRPRRLSQFAENRGVGARDLNQIITGLTAQNRETWDKTNDVSGRSILAPPGEVLTVLPPAASRASKTPCFNTLGDLTTCSNVLVGPTPPTIYGALYGMTCNGTGTGDVAGFTAAMAALPPGGGELIIPPGTCVGEFTINKPGVYRGAGLGGSTANNASTIMKGTSASASVISITAATGGVRLQDLGVTSNVAAASRTAPGAGVQVNAGPSVIIQRVYATGHLRGFLVQSAGVELHFTNSSLNSGAGYLFDGTVSAQNEIGLYSAASNLNLGDGFLVNGPGTGIWAYRLISAGNGGAGFKALRVGAGIVNDVYFTDPEVSMNTVTGIDFSSNNGGAYLTIEGGLLEASATLVNLGTGFSGVAIKGVTMADHGTGVFNNAADVVISGNIIANSSVAGIELGPTSTGAILTGNKSKAQGATPVLALNVDVGAASFVATGNDWSSATTARAGGGGLPAGSCYVNNKGDTTSTLCGSLTPGSIALASAHLLVGNVGNGAADVALSGDATISNTGVLTIANNAITMAKHATQATNTIIGNATAGTAVPTALPIGSCSTSASALTWVTNSGFGCNTAINAAQLNGATFASPGTIGGTTPGLINATGLQFGTGSASGNNLIAINIASATGRFASIQNSVGESLYGMDSAGNAYAYLNSGTGGTFFGTATNADTSFLTNGVVRLNLKKGAAHFAPNGTAPALTTCGTSPSITGTDVAGTVTMGTGAPTGCVITFNAAYGAAPQCTVTWRATPLASQSYAVSTTAITLTQTATSSNVVDYHCWGG